MDFELSEEQRLICETARRFAEKEIAPLAQECDRREQHPRELVRRAASIGLVGPTIPEAYGGPGYGFLEQALISEELSRVDLGIDQAIESAAFGSQAIVMFGSQEQKRKYLPPLAAGEALSAGAFSEPDAGTDLAGLRCKAQSDGRDYVITGNKMFITNGTVCDFMVVLARSDPRPAKRHQGLSLIIVESDRPGVTARPIKGKMGLRASDTAEIAFDSVRVPQGNLVGQEGRGFEQVMRFFDATRTAVAAQGVGLAQGALEQALAYGRQRHTFGRPLLANQSIQFTLAEMATKIELARIATYKAAWLVDQGRPSPSLNAMVKYFSGEMAVWVCNQALQMHGGYGYVDEYPISRFYRDAKILEIYEGAKEAEKMVIAKGMLS